MRLVLLASATTVAAALAGAAFAQQPPAATEVALTQSALVTLPAKSGAKLAVTTPAFANGGDIPFENTQYRDNKFPGLSWTAGPSGTQTYAVIMQDTDGLIRGAPILHWTAFNIPASVTSLAAGATDALPVGATNGPDMMGAAHAYAGPRTPAGPKHRYHLQVFALDAKLSLDPASATYDDLVAAMKGHVLASGEVVGLGAVDPTAPPRPAGAGRGGAPGAAAPVGPPPAAR